MSPLPLQKNSGKEQWRFDLGAGGLPPVIGPDDTIFLAKTGARSDKSEICALHPDGSLRWQRTLDTLAGGAAAVDSQGCLYIGGSGLSDNSPRYLFAIDPDGTEKWRAALPHFVYSGCTITSNGIYICAGRQALCFGFNGEQKWVARLGADAADQRWSPAVCPDGTLLFAKVPSFRTEKSIVIAVSPEGKVRWKAHFGTCRFTQEFAEVIEYPKVLPDGRICVIVVHERIGDVGSTGRLLSPDGEVETRLDAYIAGIGPDKTLFVFAPVGDMGGRNRLHLSRDDYCDFAVPTSRKLQRLTADYEVMWERPLGVSPQLLCTSADGYVIIRSEPRGPADEIHTPQPKEIHAISPDGDLLWTLSESDVSFWDAIIGRNGTVYVRTGRDIKVTGPATLRAIA